MSGSVLPYVCLDLIGFGFNKLAERHDFVYKLLLWLIYVFYVACLFAVSVLNFGFVCESSWLVLTLYFDVIGATDRIVYILGDHKGVFFLNKGMSVSNNRLDAHWRSEICHHK